MCSSCIAECITTFICHNRSCVGGAETSAAKKGQSNAGSSLFVADVWRHQRSYNWNGSNHHMCLRRMDCKNFDDSELAPHPLPCLRASMPSTSSKCRFSNSEISAFSPNSESCSASSAGSEWRSLRVLPVPIPSSAGHAKVSMPAEKCAQ
jgi:hypothetical protein